MMSYFFRLITIVLSGLMIVACAQILAKLPIKKTPMPEQPIIADVTPPKQEPVPSEAKPPRSTSPTQKPPLKAVSPKAASKPLLPHDGLFIRRNNEFGSQYLTGFKELIEQGDLPVNRNIRWDDFIASNSDKIPAPIGKAGLAVSYGISPIPSKYKHDGRATHYLEIALKAPSGITDNRSLDQKPPANYIFVIDTSGSMKGQKLDMVKGAVAKLFMKMRKSDVIGVIAFSDKTRTILKATRISDFTLEDFSELISGLTAKGGTDLNTGLSFGFEEISRYGNRHSVNQIFLFSDGNPTSGEQNWNNIRQNISKKAKNNSKLSLFAFGTDANIRELDALAGVTGGSYTFVTQADDVHFALNEELKRRDKVVAINVQMQIFIKPAIDIVHLYGHDLVTNPATKAAVLEKVAATKRKAKQDYGVDSGEDLVTKDEGIRIFVPNLSIGETYWVVFELAMSDGQALSNYGNATMQYVDTFARDNRQSKIALNKGGKIPANLVVEHGTGLWTSEVIFDAIDDLHQGDIGTFKQRLENHIEVLENLAGDLGSSYLADDKIVLRKFMILAENLGKPHAPSDKNAQQVTTMRSLNAFARLRNGFVQD